MKPCISQVTTLMSPFEADAAAYHGGGWTAVELWLTKLESFVQEKSLAEARAVLKSSGVRPVAAAGQGGLLLSRGEERATHWEPFRRRLALLGELGVPTLIVAADNARTGAPTAEDFAFATASLGEAAEIAASFGVRLALEFQKSSPICSCLETALAMVVQSGSRNAGVCLDVFHFQTGPSKLEDLDEVSPEHLAWVQLCDVERHPRELAGDSDRILPGDGDFPLGPIVERWRGSATMAMSRSRSRIRISGRSPAIASPTWDIRPCSACWARGSGVVGSENGRGIRRRTLSVSSVVTLQPATAIFREEQYFDWRVYALIASLEVLTGLGLLHQTAWSIELLMGLIVGIGLVMFLVFFLLHMTTEVTPTDVRVWFGWVPVYRRVVPLGDVRGSSS